MDLDDLVRAALAVHRRHPELDRAAIVVAAAGAAEVEPAPADLEAVIERIARQFDALK